MMAKSIDINSKYSKIPNCRDVGLRVVAGGGGGGSGGGGAGGLIQGKGLKMKAGRAGTAEKNP